MANTIAIYFVYVASIIISGWCGYGPGVLVVVLAVGIIPYWYRTNYSIAQTNPGVTAALLVISLFLSHASAARRRSEEDLKLLNEELEDRVHQRTAELELANKRQLAAQTQLELVTQTVAAAITRCSRDQKFIWVNARYAEWVGKPASEIIGRYIVDVLGPYRLAAAQPYIDQVLAGQNVEFQAYIEVPPLGRRWIHATYVPTYDDARAVDGWVAHVTDISAIKEAQEELARVNSHLRDANLQLARTNGDLERFAFVASHDLQEPLRMITTFSQLLVRSQNGNMGKETEFFVNNIVDGTRRMRQLLADILAYTEIDQRPQEAASIDLNVLLDNVRKNLAEPMKATNASVTADALPRLDAPEGYLLPLFQNLIENAIKYRSHEAPRIHVGTYTKEDIPHFSVSDNGIGIDPEYHQQIFTVFKRLHGGQIPGTGVGLAICQKIVERQGGRIWVESAVGAGTTVHFSLPGLHATKGGGA